MIAIDGMTVVSGQVNVLVLEEEIPTPRHHRMTLPKEHFDHIAEGSKTIEMRLYDEKRRMIRIGDTIEFACDKDEAQKLLANVQGLYVYPNFERLVEEFTLPNWDLRKPPTKKSQSICGAFTEKKRSSEAKHWRSR